MGREALGKVGVAATPKEAVMLTREQILRAHTLPIPNSEPGYTTIMIEDTAGLTGNGVHDVENVNYYKALGYTIGEDVDGRRTATIKDTNRDYIVSMYQGEHIRKAEGLDRPEPGITGAKSADRHHTFATTEVQTQRFRNKQEFEQFGHTLPSADEQKARLDAAAKDEELAAFIKGD